MSRIGNKSIKIPASVDINVCKSRMCSVKGPKGELGFGIPDGISIKMEGDTLSVVPDNDNKLTRQKWGAMRTQLSNMVVGVTQGFTRHLIIEGVGYRAQLQGTTLKMSLGYSHDVDINVPSDITVKVVKPTEIEVFGINCQNVGEFCAKIISWRPTEPYKGKGVRLRDSYVFRKEGKKK